MTEKSTVYEKMMFAEYPDIVGIGDLQKMLGIGRKAALELAKHPQIHGVIVGNRFRIPKINVIRYMLSDVQASYAKSTVLAYIQQKRIFAVQISGKYIVPKSALVDFLTDDFAFEIVHKSTWHMNTILLFAEKE